MSKFIVKPKKTAPEYDFIKQEFEIFRRGRYGKHIQVGKITEIRDELVEVRFNHRMIPVTRPELRTGQSKSWFDYEERNESISVVMSDIEAAKAFATHVGKISIWKQTWMEKQS